MDLFSQLPSNKDDKGKSNTLGIMKAFAMIGAPASLTTVLMEFGGIELSLEQKRYLNGPIIQHKSTWAESTPKWMFNQVAGDRLQVILQEIEDGKKAGWKVSPTELATALYPATMDSPIRHEHAQIYLWASAQACAKHFNKPIEFYWQQLGGQVIKDEEVIGRSGRYFYTYQDLCQTIRKKVVSVQAARETSSKSSEPKTEQKPPKMGGAEQLSLF